MADREKARARFELGLDAWLTQLEATTNIDSLWKRASDLKKHAWNIRARDPRMKRLHQKLNSALNLLIGQSVQRQKFITEFRAVKNSN
jgi:protein gp37